MIKQLLNSIKLVAIVTITALTFSSCSENSSENKEMYYMEWESFNGTDEEQAEIESFFRSFFNTTSNTFAVAGYETTTASNLYVLETLSAAGSYLYSLSEYDFTCTLLFYNATTKSVIYTFEL